MLEKAPWIEGRDGQQGQNEQWDEDKWREGDRWRIVGGMEIHREANEHFYKFVHLAGQVQDTALFSHVSCTPKSFSF